jgi:tetratricopeptide (TPR) repeat protein
MTGEPGAKSAPRPVTDERAHGPDVLGLGEQERDALLAWVGENLTLVRRSAFGQRDLYWSLGIGFVIGLAAHVGGFLLKSSATTEPLMLAADLLYALGWALWTGVVVVVFVQIYPETKKRQYQQALDAYEAAVGDRARAGSGQALPKDQGKEDQAEQWYRRAADAGDTGAMVNLGVLLKDQGKGDEAEQWFRRAADAGRRDG